jgi:predicted alpha-1,2-mannosidase
MKKLNERKPDTVDESIAMKFQLAFVCLLNCLQAGSGYPAGNGPTVPPKSIAPGEFGRRVNPFIGTGGIYYLSGNLFPGATTPFGMVRLSPDTVSGTGRRARNTSGYYYRDERILGFSHTRLCGTGATDGGNFLVIPGLAGQMAKSPRDGMNAPFSHKNEIAFPGYYAIKFPELGIAAELTATRRVGVHRYTFAEGRVPRLLIHVSSVLGRGRSKDGQVRIIPEVNEIEGSVRTFGTFAQRYGGLKTYFVARCNRRFAEHAAWPDDKFVPARTMAVGDDVGVELTFEKSQAPLQVELKVGISYVSIANARANLEAEAGTADFDQVFAKARDEWEQMLSRIRIEGGTDKQQTIFYTALYHSVQMPTVFNDVNGDYLGFDGKVHRASGFTYYTDMSLWDTFRTTHPLYMLIAPREQRDMVLSLVEMSKQGGYLPRWPSGNGYTNSMFGTPADVMITETYLKGIRDFDVQAAYAAMRKTALGPTVKSRFSGRAGIEEYLKYRYCPADRMKQSVARTLEYGYADHSVARLAEALGRHEDAALFGEHALYYRNLWNPETQYFQPRDSKKSFQPFSPHLLTYVDPGGKLTGAYVEGSALQWRWAVPFDAKGLISLFKSREYFVKELEEFFSHSVAEVGSSPNAYYWHGNEPDIYAPFLFNAADRPDLTQKWVRWILAVKYGDQDNGLDGNDDGGTLSAWYVLASLGLFPTAGSETYQITSPLWTQAAVQIGAQRLRIVAKPAAPANAYVRSVQLNGARLDRWSINHTEIASGGELRFELGPGPTTK